MSSIISKLINLAGNITGTLPVANGGTALTSGTSGGVLGYTASGTLASSGALTQNAVVIGGGAGATPTTISAGTNGQLLVGVTSGAPAWGNTVSALTTFNSGVVVSNAASQSTFSNYQISSTASTFTFDGTGSPVASASMTMRYVRVGDWVYLHVPGINATTIVNSVNLTANTAIDAFARPATNAQYGLAVQMKNNGSILTTPGQIQVSTGGFVSFQRDSGGTSFSPAAAAGPNQGFVFSYYVGTGS